MNAIIGMCHFCEAHGPCILFCTQAFHSGQDAQLLMDSVPPDKRVPHYAAPLGVAKSSRRTVDDEGSVVASSSDGGGSGTGDGSVGVVPSIIHPPPQPSADQCEGCCSMSEDQQGFLSYDDQSRISYVSGQYPEQPQLYSVLRQACVRSLNCEVCPGREGPIVFGEDGGCHVLSHTFNLQDTQARGFSSLYSLIVVMMDRVFLINSWPFLVKHFRKLIDDLQAKADKVFASESDETKSTSSSRSLRSSVSSLDHLRRVRTNQSGRSLVDLTGDTEVFLYLHKYFVFLLKAGGQRVIECVLEGPPRVMAVGTSALPQAQDVGGAEGEEPWLEKPLSVVDFHVVKVEGQPVFQTLKHLFSVLDKQDFAELAYHILKGDQLIVRGSDVTTVTSIISILKDLIPDSCSQIVSFSSIYKEPFVCNFLGLSVGVELPTHVVASELHVLLDILPPLRRHYSKLNEDPAPCPDADPLRHYKLMVYSAAQRLPEHKYPMLLQRLMALLVGDLSDSLVNRGVATLKEEWMNKVKVLYKFSQMGHMDHKQGSERLTKLLSDVLLVGQEELGILQYWRSALSKDYKSHLIKAEKS